MGICFCHETTCQIVQRILATHHMQCILLLHTLLWLLKKCLLSTCPNSGPYHVGRFVTQNVQYAKHKTEPAGSMKLSKWNIHTDCKMSVCSHTSTLADWFHHKIMLSSLRLKLWSHRYVCSICSVWHWIIHFLFCLSHCFWSGSSGLPFPYLFNFLLLLPTFPFCLHPAHAYPPNLIPLVTIFFHCFLLLLLHDQFFSPSSPVLSVLSYVSAVSPFHLLIPVLIQAHIAFSHTWLCLPTAQNPPEDVWSPVCPHAHTRLLCRKMPFVKGQGASISQLGHLAVWFFFLKLWIFCELLFFFIAIKELMVTSCNCSHKLCANIIRLVTLIFES